jgi:hypothetical protein
MTCEGEKFTAPINRTETYLVNRRSAFAGASANGRVDAHVNAHRLI